MAPRVSVLIPTYGRPEALSECLGAIAGQDFRDFECIVINDGGPPVDAALARHPQLPVRLVNLPENQGHAAARNEGLRRARGEFVALCDDDDLWLPGHLGSLVAAADAGADLVYTDAELVVFRSTPRGRVPLRRHLFAFDFDPQRLRRWNTIIPSAALYRRALHDTLGPFDVAVRDYWDWDWWLRVTPGRRVRRIPEASVLVAVDEAGANASADPARMAPYLERLVHKHGLGPLPASNFLRMLSEPELRPVVCDSARPWDGARLPGA